MTSRLDAHAYNIGTLEDGHELWLSYNRVARRGDVLDVTIDDETRTYRMASTFARDLGRRT